MVDLQTQYQRIKHELEPAVLSVLESGRYVQGENVEALEAEVAHLCRARYAIGVNSGTDALKLSLHALGIKPGDEVITTPFTFVATAEVVVHLGARPVFVDIDPLTYNLDVDQIERTITPRTRAIIPVDLYGQIAEMKAIREIANRHGLFVVEDAAQALGARHHNEPIGRFAHTATISFFPTKNVGAAGDAGMVITDDPILAQKIRSLRVHGTNGTGYYYKAIGYTSRLDELQAAILRVKMRHLHEWNERRRYHAALYRTLLAETGLQLPVVAPYNYHVYHQFTVRHPRRESLRTALKERGIDTAIYYPLPLHVQDAYCSLGYEQGDFPHSERAAKEVFSLPVHAELTEDQISYATDTIQQLIQSEVMVG